MCPHVWTLRAEDCSLYPLCEEVLGPLAGSVRVRRIASSAIAGLD